MLINGPQPVSFPQVISDDVYTIGAVHISKIQIIILTTASLMMLGLHLTVKHVKIGKAMRAASEDYDTTSLMGINVNQVISFTFAIGSGLAAAGGGTGGHVLQFGGPANGNDGRNQSVLRRGAGRYRQYPGACSAT